MHIVCSHCFATNRLPEDKQVAEAKCGKCQKTVYSGKPVVLGSNNFYAFIERNDMPIIVDFWASWCGPCQAMAPVFENVAKQSAGLLFAKLNTEHAQQISADAGIRSIPTLIFFHKGKELDRVSGGLSEAQLKTWVMQCVQKHSAKSNKL
ncbi:thioredoxin TrxC [Paraglaciecola sp.]|uniref:thioredoxin TrxC n=1 Tax=Paraglaciecola sp. TaxID=1920173 RepID=UPI003EF8B5B5